MFRHSLFIISLLFLVSACSRKETGSLPASEGSPGEVLVVCHEELKDEIEKAFGTDFPLKDSILLLAEKAESRQFEPSLAFWYARHQAYEGSEKQAPMIVVAETAKKAAGEFSDDLEDLKPESSKRIADCDISVYRNVWATKQTVVRLKTEKVSYPKEALNHVVGLLRDAEVRQGLTGNLAPTRYCDSISNAIEGQYGFRFRFPPQFRLEFTNREVVWLWQETNRFYRHVFVNIFRDSQNIDTKDAAVANRNAFAARYLKNEEGTMVRVSESALFPLTWERNVQAGRMKADVLRGWYAEEGTFRRGPFVRYFFRDAQNRRIIALDGFLHAPDMPRLTFYRTFDLIAATFELK